MDVEPSFVSNRSEEYEVEEEESFVSQFCRMNEEFEKLVWGLKRGIGSLLMNRKSKRERFGKQQEDDDEEDGLGFDNGNGKGREDDDDDEGFVEEQDGLDCLMYLECRLDEWIP
ncbi:uncharacterized protein MELLADRAFT_71121 [Melampsora larici-populina 98AG31]|uniref:Uncharacterized protein n=1 Tax=Melampsora larici-populina (strain 98AG31 / pathotype 3-4-7) TaxID=747676 RepID=F4RCG9_MELLP|nr:uncharacterized protein MELLADRAFT_71121 [Melampsora larici-populina 98AG31]EGG09729.1 hypothetical protein MELLADRAFT_71121 [Melampsora larici-populina 98AG31]